MMFAFSAASNVRILSWVVKSWQKSALWQRFDHEDTDAAPGLSRTEPRGLRYVPPHDRSVTTINLRS
jgi:hypothetical protein